LPYKNKEYYMDINKIRKIIRETDCSFSVALPNIISNPYVMVKKHKNVKKKLRIHLHKFLLS
jgi:hypothetical protein